MKKADLTALLENVEEDARAIAEGLIEEIVFQKKILKRLKKEIAEEGTVPLKLRTYNQTVQRFGGLCSQLEKLIRRNEKFETGENALQRWLEASK